MHVDIYRFCISNAIVFVPRITAQLCWGETAIFTCYNSDDSCDKQFVKYEYPEYNVNDAIKRCCLEFNGISYVSTESSEGCSQCIGKLLAYLRPIPTPTLITTLSLLAYIYIYRHRHSSARRFIVLSTVSSNLVPGPNSWFECMQY